MNTHRFFEVGLTYLPYQPRRRSSVRSVTNSSNSLPAQSNNVGSIFEMWILVRVTIRICDVGVTILNRETRNSINPKQQVIFEWLGWYDND